MVYEYLITLRRNQARFVDQVSMLMYVFAILMFLYFFYASSFAAYYYIIIVAGIVLAWVVTFYRKKANGTGYFRIGLLIAVAGWLMFPFRNMWMAVLYGIAALVERQVKFPAEIGFSKEKIQFNTLLRKSLQWSDVTNVMIKDGLLTIDQKNNRLFQKEVEGDVDHTVENEFNTFCKMCMINAGYLG